MRTGICIALISLIIFLSAGTEIYVRNTEKNMQNRISEITASAENDDMETVKKQMEEFYDYWTHEKSKVTLIIRRTYVDELSVSIARLKSLVDFREELLYEIQRVKMLCHVSFENEFLNINNVL